MKSSRHLLDSAQRRVCRRRLLGGHVDAGTALWRGERFGKSRLAGDPYASHVPEWTRVSFDGAPSRGHARRNRGGSDQGPTRYQKASHARRIGGCRTDQGHARGPVAASEQPDHQCRRGCPQSKSFACLCPAAGGYALPMFDLGRTFLAAVERSPGRPRSSTASGGSAMRPGMRRSRASPAG